VIDMLRILLLVTAWLCASFAMAAAEPAAAPAAADPPIRKYDGVLVDIKGRGLYTWDGDKTPGVSSCNGQCRLLWPPIIAEPGAMPKGPFTLARRDDGRMQWALRGRPLYRWVSDKKFGDAGGDGVSGTWRLVRVPKPTPSQPATPTEPSP
jgi:predicted lipoprotein with Yx(FWY)xxD motif